MDSITIKISGLGMTISKETYLIADFLKSKGYDVEIEDKHPPMKPITDLSIIEGNDRKIKIVTEHYPWPG